MGAGRGGREGLQGLRDREKGGWRAGGWAGASPGMQQLHGDGGTACKAQGHCIIMTANACTAPLPVCSAVQALHGRHQPMVLCCPACPQAPVEEEDACARPLYRSTHACKPLLAVSLAALYGQPTRSPPLTCVLPPTRHCHCSWWCGVLPCRPARPRALRPARRRWLSASTRTPPSRASPSTRPTCRPLHKTPSST